MVDLVECHATATVQGDLEEIRALKSFYSNGRRVMLSSFKSQIGHCLGASGINNLVRGVMALQNGIFPPTLNYRTPDAEIDMERWGFHVIPQPEAWARPANQPRRLQINAFGFGGANFVVHVEECLSGTGVVLVSDAPRPPAGPEVQEEPAPSGGDGGGVVPEDQDFGPSPSTGGGGRRRYRGSGESGGPYSHHRPAGG